MPICPEFQEAAIRVLDTRPGGLHDKSRHDFVTPGNSPELKMAVSH